MRKTSSRVNLKKPVIPGKLEKADLDDCYCIVWKGPNEQFDANLPKTYVGSPRKVMELLRLAYNWDEENPHQYLTFTSFKETLEFAQRAGIQIYRIKELVREREMNDEQITSEIHV